MVEYSNKQDFVANLLLSLTVKKKSENYRLTYGEVMGESLVSCFFSDSVQFKVNGQN